MDLKFKNKNYETRNLEVDGDTICFRAFENIVYVEHPVDTKYQSLHVYVPEDYYQGKSINGYTLKTAPIFLGNNIGGFFPSEARKPEQEMFGHTSTYFYALRHGYVVVSPGARGRTNVTDDGKFYGKAPACVVDMKAVVRYIKTNAGVIPGDTEKIISNGTSAGGNVSALLGVTPGAKEFEPYLKELGAAEADDSVFATSCYCPTADLEHADIAYEWQFQGIRDFHRMHMEMSEGGRPNFSPIDGVMTERQVEISNELAANFSEYLNSYHFKTEDGEELSLDANGDGSFKRYIEKCIENASPDKSKKIEFSQFMKEITRMKEAPAFDDVTMENFENNLFGNATADNSHFTKYSFEHSVNENPQMASEDVIKMMNPIPFITENADMSRYFRIRQGTMDRDVGFATPVILALKLKETGVNVDYKMCWGVKHDGDYDLPELFAWIDTIVRK